MKFAPNGVGKFLRTTAILGALLVVGFSARAEAQVHVYRPIDISTGTTLSGDPRIGVFKNPKGGPDIVLICYVEIVDGKRTWKVAAGGIHSYPDGSGVLSTTFPGLTGSLFPDGDGYKLVCADGGMDRLAPYSVWDWPCPKP